MTKRPYISLKTKLASALCQMLRPDDSGKLVRVIDHETAKALTEDQVLSLFHFDHHPIPVHLGGGKEHWNLTPRPIMEHREKTAKIDIPFAAKVDRVTPKQEEFRRKMLAKAGLGEPEPKAEKTKRKWRPAGTKFDWGKGRYVRQD